MDKIAILDFGGQYAHLIANRVRRLGVYSEILEPEASLDKFAEYKGLILSGGPRSVYEKNAPALDPKIFLLDVPVLGICYGHQLIAHLLKGKVTPGKVKEYGLAKLHIKRSHGVFEGLGKRGGATKPLTTSVWMSHGDTVSKLPPGFEVFGSTSDCKNAAFGDPIHNIYGVQFHVEVAHTPEGMKILSNFLDLCECKREWNMSRFLEAEMAEVKQRVFNRKVFFLVSGGVDSTVAFTLLNQALGPDKMYGLFVDTGFLRKDEPRKVKSALRALGFKNFHTVNASQKFYKALKNVTDPEEKRNIIGRVFLEVQRQEVRRLRLNPRHWLLGQGTIYPDTIESAGTKYAAKIKTHHNRVPEIEELMKKGFVVEPLKNLYKDEVREVGKKLGLASSLVWRHPFPGPGLAVRLLCLKNPSHLQSRIALEKKIEQFCRQKAWKNLSAKILSLRSVGVQGDDRTYRHPLLLFGGFHDWEKLEELSTSLTNHFKEINRVCIALFPEKPQTTHVFSASIVKKRVQLLQEADDIVTRFIKKKKIGSEIWQFPVILLPISLQYIKLRKLIKNYPRSLPEGGTILLRPVSSQEAMTANFYKMNWNWLFELTQKLQKIPGVSGIIYDITNKPPGTIEWE